ncbi:MAG: RNA methyltransferase [Cyanobacteriota bacterium]|nr:RNA methyltransferase [Cyanobacteriota bacterium]
MALPDQLFVSDLLRRRVRCDQGLDHGAGLLAWMHPPVHRLLGWATRPSQFGDRRQVWRLDQLCGLSDQEAFVRGEPAETDPATLRQLPTLFDASLVAADRQSLGSIVDAAVDLRTGRILHYLVARSDPRLPGSSRWRLALDRIVDQQPGRVFTALRGLDDLPLARASVRQEWLRRSRRWRDRLQTASGQLEDRLEGWLEDAPWPDDGDDDDRRPPSPPPWEGNDPLEDDLWGDEPVSRRRSSS